MSSTLSHVCVFPSRAKLTHDVDVDETEGASIEALSPFIDDASITARVLEGEGEIREVRVERYLAESATSTDERARTLRHDKISLQREVAHLKSELESLRTLVQDAQSTRVAPGESFVRPDSKTLLSAQTALSEFVTVQSVSVLSEIDEKTKRIETIDKELLSLKDSPGKFRWAKRIRLAASASCRVALSYVTLGASWRPSYQVFFDTENKRVRVRMIAAIAQQTACDWSGVPVRVSTAADARITPLPKWKALRIGKAQSAVESDFRPPPTNPGVLYADYDLAVRDQTVQRTVRSTASFGAATYSGEMARAGEAQEEFGEPIEEALLMSDQQAPVQRKAHVKSGSARRKRSAPMAPPAAAAPLPQARAAPGTLVGSAALDSPKASSDTLNDLWLHYELLELATPKDTGRRGRLTFRQNDIDDELRLAPPPPLTTLPSASGRAAFDLSGAVSLPASGQWRTFVVGTWEAENASLEHVVVPRKAREVFRTLRFVNPVEGPLFSGPTSIFVDDRLLATNHTGHVPSGGEIRLGAGVNEALSVTRDARFEEESAGLFSGSKMLHHRIRIEIHNASDKSETLRVRDRIPMPMDDNTKVEVLLRKAAPEEGRVHKKQFEQSGEMRWEFDMKPREQRVIELEYTLRIKNGQEIVGGNRREP